MSAVLRTDHIDGMATVTRLPVAPLAEAWHPDVPVLVTSLRERPHVGGLPVDTLPALPVSRPLLSDVPPKLVDLGVPEYLLGPDFIADMAAQGTYAALTRALSARLPAAPKPPNRPGEVLFVVGHGIEALSAARALAVSLRLDAERVQWATPGELAGLAPAASRITTVEAAAQRRREAASAGTMTIVAVEAPLRRGSNWLSQMIDTWAPAAVWAIVEATRKPEDLLPWLDGLAEVDALIVQDTDLSADPAAVLHSVAAPVALLDGVRATPHRWASLLCERLEGGSA